MADDHKIDFETLRNRLNRAEADTAPSSLASCVYCVRQPPRSATSTSTAGIAMLKARNQLTLNLPICDRCAKIHGICMIGGSILGMIGGLSFFGAIVLAFIEGLDEPSTRAGTAFFGGMALFAFGMFSMPFTPRIFGTKIDAEVKHPLIAEAEEKGFEIDPIYLLRQFMS